MRMFIFLANTAIVAACNQPGVDVKTQWNKSIANYAMIPLYPMREDVYVGDIRIHTLPRGKSSTLDSRLLGRLESVDAHEKLIEKEQGSPDYSDPKFPPENLDKKALTLAAAAGIPKIGDAETGGGAETTAKVAELLAAATLQVERWDQPDYDLHPKNDKVDKEGKPVLQDGFGVKEPRTIKRLPRVALPRLDAARVTRVDGEARGLLKAWNYVIGGEIEDKETVMISLTQLETAELDDTDVIKAFHDQVTNSINADNKEFLFAACHAALSWGDPAFNDTAISMVTRVFYARGVQYSYGKNFGAALEASLSPAGSVGTKLKNAEIGAGAATAGRLSLNEEFNAPMAFGVDAVMLSPKALGLDTRCDDVQHKFLPSPLKSNLRARAVGN